MRSLIRSIFVLCAAIALASFSGCFLINQQQYVVDILTDAPVPSWGDRVLVEVLENDGTLACSECRREFTVTAASFPLKFGVAATDDTKNLHVRARFYQASQVGADGVPHDTNLIDVVGRLPDFSTVHEHIYEGFLILTGFCYGLPVTNANGQFRTCSLEGDGSTVGPEPGIPEKAEDADFHGLLPGQLLSPAAPCDGSPPTGMRCVPARPFLLGELRTLGVDTDYPAQPLHAIVPYAAYYVDEDEMSVGVVRKLIASRAISSAGIAARGSQAGTEHCTYLSATSTQNDALPLNCVDYKTALGICQALGKELPSEDVWENAAQNGEDENPYPWGRDPPSCDRAIVAADSSCPRSGPVAGGATGDVTPLGLRNMGGNLSEWVYGPLVGYDDPCWGVGNDNWYDGSCTDDPSSLDNFGLRGHRGGSFARRATSAATFTRFAAPGETKAPDIGFRCAQRLPDVSTP